MSDSPETSTQPVTPARTVSNRRSVERARRRRRLARPILFAIVAAALSALTLGPFWREGVYHNGDLWNFLGGVVEARNALAEGQFPIRVAPNQLDGDRYPVFQFYANLPYTVAGLLLGPTGKNPYAAWRTTLFIALALGGFCAQRLVWKWTRSWAAAVAAVAVLLSSPYLLTDLYDRGAVAEAIALALLPVALLATWSCLARPGLSRVAGCAIAWTAIGLTHNITYLYGATWVGLFVLGLVRVNRRWAGRLGRLTAAGVLHAGLVAWYVAPQFSVMPVLGIAGNLVPPRDSAALVPLSVLLWPTVRTPIVSTIPRLGLQVGWLVIAASLLAALSLVFPRRRDRSTSRGLAVRSRWTARLVVRLLALWMLAFFVAWQPIDFWRWVPKAFYFVQFSYRLIGLVLVLAAMLAGLAVARFTSTGGSGRRSAGHARGWAWAAVTVSLAGLTFFLYFPHGQYTVRGGHRWINDDPKMGGLADYVASPQPELVASAETAVRSAGETRDARRHGRPTLFDVQCDGSTWVVLPVLWYPNLLRIDVDGASTPYQASQSYAAVKVGPGRHSISVRFAGLGWANGVSAASATLATVLLLWPFGRRLLRRWKAWQTPPADTARHPTAI